MSSNENPPSKSSLSSTQTDPDAPGYGPEAPVDPEKTSYGQGTASWQAAPLPGQWLAGAAAPVRAVRAGTEALTGQ
jgi:hypothetical protein